MVGYVGECDGFSFDEELGAYGVAYTEFAVFGGDDFEAVVTQIAQGEFPVGMPGELQFVASGEVAGLEGVDVEI